jgi:hypothetical protein
MSIADIGKFWDILVIPVLQILEDSVGTKGFKSCAKLTNDWCPTDQAYP